MTLNTKVLRPLTSGIVKDATAQGERHDDEILERIRSILPADTTLLHVSIVGSRGKGMASPGSDYDTNVIIVYPARQYMLGKVKRSIKFELLLNDETELEGTIMDIRTLYQYALENNLQAYETFFGNTIYTSSAANDVKNIFLQSYQPSKIQKSILGKLHGYRKKKMASATTGPIIQGKQTTLKVATEAAYLSLQLLYMVDKHVTPPAFSIRRLLQQLGQRDLLSQDQQEWIHEMLEKRRCDKDAAYHLTEELQVLMDNATALTAGSIRKYSNDTNHQKDAGRIKAIAEQQFLDLFGVS